MSDSIREFNIVVVATVNEHGTISLAVDPERTDILLNHHMVYETTDNGVDIRNILDHEEPTWIDIIWTIKNLVEGEQEDE